jgi:hypothetical protein
MICKDTASPARTQVTLVTQTLTKQIQYTVADNIFAGIPAGTKVKVFVSGVQGAATSNGSQIVIPSAPNSCTTVKQIPTFAYTSGGFMTFSRPLFYLIGGLFTRRLVERKAGRPLYLSRGRQRARRLA